LWTLYKKSPAATAVGAIKVFGFSNLFTKRFEPPEAQNLRFLQNPNGRTQFAPALILWTLYKKSPAATAVGAIKVFEDF